MKGKIFTPVSLVKKTFKYGERSLSREEITQRLLALTEDLGFDADKCIQAALNHPFSPFREGNSRAIVEFVHATAPLANHVYRLINEAGVPISEEKILRKLRSMNLVSWNYSFDRLSLHSDSRFSQLQSDGRWCCSQWEVVNSDIYRFLLNQGTKEMPVSDISFMIQNRLDLPKNHRLFVPQVDERFFVEADKLYLVEQTIELPISEVQANHLIHNTYSEVAVAMNQEVVERNQQVTKTVVDEVVEDLMGALIKLEKRSNEMKEEVLQYFASNDLVSIQSLIQEKDKNEKVLDKLQALVNELS